MSLQSDDPKQCKKISYASAKEAGEALDSARLDHAGNRKVENRYFWHRPCGAYHLTSQSRASRRR